MQCVYLTLGEYDVCWCAAGSFIRCGCKGPTVKGASEAGGQAADIPAAAARNARANIA